MSRIDLHAHTIHSDGTLTPTALVRLARDVGLSLLAVTDHDTTAGLAEARAEGARVGVEIVAGCEVSTLLPQGNVHVLGLGFDPDDATFQAFLAEVRNARDERNTRMLARLAAVGKPLTLDEVRKHELDLAFWNTWMKVINVACVFCVPPMTAFTIFTTYG